MSRRPAWRIAGPVLWLPSTALAHSPIKGLDNFYAGLLHPVFVPAHLLVLLTLGILFGQQGAQRMQRPIIGFLCALLAGLALSAWPGLPAVEYALLVGAVANGLLIALDRTAATWAAASLGALLGLLLGIDSAQAGLAGRGWLAAMSGSALGAYLLMLYAMLAAERFGGAHWQRVGLRILGSWSAASALLVLSLSLAG